MNSDASTGFIAIYRWRVAAEHQADFRERWREVTRQGSEHGPLAHALVMAPMTNW